MALRPGVHLGAYEIVALIGAGGMGEVYRARDTRLKRDVAIKILPDAFANDAERLARFQREAELLATLNHPNIAQIHGLEDGALVLELVEGPTLADRIAQGSVPLDEALSIALQIAEALESAHERGIIHRDLKPANIKLTVDGKVKVLDFGLAKLADNGRVLPQSDLSMSPTITSPVMTMGGVILGTAAYMSPEQARGKPVDKRADIWAFGCVLYEMLTRGRAFDASEVTDTLALIITKEPDFSALPNGTPAAVARLLRRCLQKELRQRLPDIGGARLEIDDALGSNEVAPGVPSPTKTKWAWRGPVATLALIALAISATWVARTVPAPRLDPIRFSFDTGRMQSPPVLAVSPDGRYIASVVSPVGSALMLRSLASGDSRSVTGTEGGILPFWSPDSAEVAFFSDGKLKKVAVAGGPVQIICDTGPFPRGGTWNEDGVILFSLVGESPLQRVASNGGSPTSLHPAATTNSAHPQFISRNRFIYLKAGPQSVPQGIYAASLDSPEQAFIMASSIAASYAAGYLFFVRDTALLAQPFNPSTLTLSGTAMPVAQNVGTSRNSLYASFSVSERVLAHRAGRAAENAELLWVDRSGSKLGSTLEQGPWMAVNLSRDESHLLVPRLEAAEGGGHLWTIDLDRNVAARLTTSAGDSDGNWTPDGRTVYFSSIRRGRPEIYKANASGIGTQELVADGGRMSDISRDGKFLLQLMQDGLTAIALPGLERQHLLKGRIEEARFSPDNKWIAFNTNQADRHEVYVVPFPQVDKRWQVSTGGGVQPRWRNDGRELFYVAPDGPLTSVQVDENAGGLRFSRPTPLFRTGLESTFFTDEYDVAAKGQRFILVRPVASTNPTPVNVLVNWSSVLKR